MTPQLAQLPEATERLRATVEAFEREVARTKALAERLERDNEERRRQIEKTETPA